MYLPEGRFDSIFEALGFYPAAINGDDIMLPRSRSDLCAPFWWFLVTRCVLPYPVVSLIEGPPRFWLLSLPVDKKPRDSFCASFRISEIDIARLEILRCLGARFDMDCERVSEGYAYTSFGDCGLVESKLTKRSSY